LTEQKLQQLIQSCKNQDASGQKQLYRHFYSYGMTICSRYARNREEAKEIMNDGFVKIFTKLDKYTPSLSFKAWVNKIFVNTAIDHYRKNKKEPITVDLIHAQYKETNATILEELSARDLLSLVQKLPPSYRIAFNLFVVEGFSHEEIATKLNINKGTSKSNLAKARMKLKAMLQSTGVIKNKYGS